MARFAIIRRIIICAPGDASDLVDVGFSVANRINRSIHMNSELLEPIHWSTHTRPGFNENGGQAEINRQIVDQSDILIAFFRNRLGTPTSDHESGTVEEIKRHVGNNKPAMVYFSSEDLPRDHDKLELARLEAFKSWCFERGLMGSYSGHDNLSSLLEQNIKLLVTQNPISAEEKVASLANKTARELELLSRDRREFRFGDIKIDDDGVELRCRLFALDKAEDSLSSTWWTSITEFVVDPNLMLKMAKIRKHLNGEIYNSFKFYLHVPNKEVIKKKYRNRLVNADAVVTGFGDKDPEENGWWRIWFLHPEGFIHPYLSKTYLANHSVIDLSCV